MSVSDFEGWRGGPRCLADSPPPAPITTEDIAVVFRKETWEARADFSQADVHRQVAIVFKTPPYQHLELAEPVEVEVFLQRLTDSVCSESFRFTYLPKDHGTCAATALRGGQEAPGMGTGPPGLGCGPWDGDSPPGMGTGRLERDQREWGHPAEMSVIAHGIGDRPLGWGHRVGTGPPRVGMWPAGWGQPTWAGDLGWKREYEACGMGMALSRLGTGSRRGDKAEGVGGTPGEALAHPHPSPQMPMG